MIEAADLLDMDGEWVACLLGESSVSLGKSPRALQISPHGILLFGVHSKTDLNACIYDVATHRFQDKGCVYQESEVGLFQSTTFELDKRQIVLGFLGPTNTSSETLSLDPYILQLNLYTFESSVISSREWHPWFH